MTIPVALVAMFQFGISPTFWYLIVAFAVSQLLDGNLLVPYLFSEVVNLHPLVIIISVLILADYGVLGRIFRYSIGNARQSCAECIARLDRIKTIKES